MSSIGHDIEENKGKFSRRDESALSNNLDKEICGAWGNFGFSTSTATTATVDDGSRCARIQSFYSEYCDANQWTKYESLLNEEDVDELGKIFVDNGFQVPIQAKYDVLKRIGRGSYGIVWRAMDRETGERVALKKIYDAFVNSTDAQRTYREIAILLKFGKHPNIMPLYKVHRAVEESDIFLVFPLMACDLCKVIRYAPDNLLRQKTVDIIYQITNGIMFLHSADIIHRDLKPANILLDDNFLVKLGDFGLARTFYPPDSDWFYHSGMTKYVSTRWYRAPEILMSCEYYGKEVDMWAIGCILGEMIMKKPLFSGASSIDMLHRILSSIDMPTAEELDDMYTYHADEGSNRWMVKTIIESVRGRINKRGLWGTLLDRSRFNQLQVQLIEGLLIFNPKRRLTAEQVLVSPYLRRSRMPQLEFRSNEPSHPGVCDDFKYPTKKYKEFVSELLYKFDELGCSLIPCNSTVSIEKTTAQPIEKGDSWTIKDSFTTGIASSKQKNPEMLPFNRSDDSSTDKRGVLSKNTKQDSAYTWSGPISTSTSISPFKTSTSSKLDGTQNGMTYRKMCQQGTTNKTKTHQISANIPVGIKINRNTRVRNKTMLHGMSKDDQNDQKFILPSLCHFQEREVFTVIKRDKRKDSIKHDSSTNKRNSIKTVDDMRLAINAWGEEPKRQGDFNLNKTRSVNDLSCKMRHNHPSKRSSLTQLPHIAPIAVLKESKHLTARLQPMAQEQSLYFKENTGHSNNSSFISKQARKLPHPMAKTK